MTHKNIFRSQVFVGLLKVLFIFLYCVIILVFLNPSCAEI